MWLVVHVMFLFLCNNFLKESVFFLLREDKNVLKCEKCLRIVGLWLFECLFYEDENEVTIEIKSIMDKIINSLEFSSDNYYCYYYENLNSSNKRKLDVYLVCGYKFNLFQFKCLFF